MKAPTVSFLITLYNKAQWIGATLDSLRAQDGLAADAMEIVIADDASSDGSPERVEAAARRDQRIRVIRNAENHGPAIRLNQAAEAARGRWLIPVDADDLLAPNAAALLLATACTVEAPLVFGRARRTAQIGLAEQDGPVETDEDALAFCAERQIVHMGFLADAALWRKARGADERIFIQDQSLPLRLCAAAKRVARIDALVYALRPPEADSLSQNVRQQHHDRFLAATSMLDREDVTARARRALIRQAASALWKLKRDSAGPLAAASPDFLRYIANRAMGFEPDRAALTAAGARLARLPGIRRPGAAGAKMS